MTKTNSTPKPVTKRAKKPQKERQLDACMSRYQLMLADPFDHKADGVCIPDGQGGRTLKYKTVVRASEYSLGGSGLQVLVHPRASNDRESITISNTASHTNFDQLSPDAAHIAVGSPFESTAFGSGKLEQRLVGWGLRVRTTTPSLYAQGTAMGYVLMNSTDGSAIANLDGLRAHESQPVTARVSKEAMSKSGLLLRGVGDNWEMYSDWESSDRAYNLSSAKYVGQVPYSFAFVNIPAGSGTAVITIDIEFVAHWEVRGRTVMGLGTANMKPAPALSERAWTAAVNVVQSAAQNVPPDMVYKGVKLAVQAYLGTPLPQGALSM